jgi:hypothetical protein
MSKPDHIRKAEMIIYVSIAASAVVSLIDKWIGAIGPGNFAFQLMVYGFLCMIPYKISRGSNPARYVYVVICVIALFLMLGGGIRVPRLDLLLSVIMIPVEAYVIWMLFHPDASRWFAGEGGGKGDRFPRAFNERREPKL